MISLNLEDSILTPSENEHQKFCYDIVGVGNDQPQDADLNHLLFGICPFIKEEDIVDLSVSINDDPQTILWGENAEIKTAENPDHPTGCIGLKLDFPLNKINGYMKVCFSLRTVYTIGPVNVCLFGGNTYGDRFDGLWSGLWIERVLRIYLLSEREYLCSGYHYTLCDTGNCYGNMLRNADHTSGNNLWRRADILHVYGHSEFVYRDPNLFWGCH